MSSERRPRRGRTGGLAASFLLAAVAAAGSPLRADAPAPGPAAPVPGPPALASAAAPDLQPVGAEDLLEISVFEIPDLNRTVRITERGTISLPLLGEIRVLGLSPVQVEERLKRELSRKYLQDPQVSVYVREHGSRKVSVLGAVGKPGVYEMLGPRTLMQILSEAGGLTKDVGATLYVLRQRRAVPDADPAAGTGAVAGTDAAAGPAADDPPEPGAVPTPENPPAPGAPGVLTIAVGVDALMTNRDPSLDIAIEPGDIVSVPNDRVLYIYVDGAVKTPGRIDQLASRSITLMQAIAKAGGPTDRANLKKVQIVRKDGTGEVRPHNVLRIRQGKDPDPELRDGDVVVVPESFF